MKKILLIFLLCIFKSMPIYAIDISAKSACLISADTGEIIYAKNENEKMSMASTTKIMTGLLAAESGRLFETVTISENAQNQEGSSIYLRSGEKILLEDLLYGLMLNSGNDAAVAIAEHLTGSIETFSEEMTARARQIGAVNTCFKNPSGLEENGHFTTAFELALIGAEAMKNDIFKEVVSTKSKTATSEDGKIFYFTNHNKLLKGYDGANGIKTGFTKAAGRCLVSSAEKNGIRLVAVTLGAPDDWNDHKKMLDYGFSRVRKELAVKKGQILRRIKKDACEYTFSANEDVVISAASELKLKLEVCMPKSLPVPISAGEKAGVLRIYNGERLIKEVDIVSNSDIEEQFSFVKSKYISSIKRVLRKFCIIRK